MCKTDGSDLRFYWCAFGNRWSGVRQSGRPARASLRCVEATERASSDGEFKNRTWRTKKNKTETQIRETIEKYILILLLLLISRGERVRLHSRPRFQSKKKKKKKKKNEHSTGSASIVVSGI